MSVAQEKLSAPSGPISAKNPQSFRPCVVVPVFNHSVALDETFRRLAGLNLPCFFINDGSTDGSGHKMSLLCAANDNFQLHSHLINQGKGAAVLTGFREAVLQGYSHAIQID